MNYGKGPGLQPPNALMTSRPVNMSAGPILQPQRPRSQNAIDHSDEFRSPGGLTTMQKFAQATP